MFHVEHLQFGIYVHIPFCKTKCGYCDFCRTTHFSLLSGYLKSLKNEILNSELLGHSPLTIYIGGGTPSSIGIDNLRFVLTLLSEKFNLNNIVEFTVECNPDDVTNDLAFLLSQFNVNRVSMGSQSLDNNMLKLMMRRHTSQQVVRSIAILNNNDISNISVDMIYGLPKLDDYSFADDLKKFMNLGVPHISAYSLSYEPGSIFTKWLNSGKLTSLSDDEVADQYNLLTQVMSDHGYRHYEISNYSIKGFESRHNSSYWIRLPYAGFGAGASSFLNGIRKTNTYDVSEYISKKGLNCFENDILSSNDIYNEKLMLSLRTSNGLNINDLDQADITFFKNSIAKEIRNGFIEIIDDNHFRIPEDKWFVSDSILERLFK